MAKGLFQPPSDALSIYEGEVMHARMKPFSHRFTYRVFSTLVDLDRLDEVASLSAIFLSSAIGVSGVIVTPQASESDSNIEMRAH